MMSGRFSLLLIAALLAGVAASSDDTKGSITLMTFNIRYGTADDGPNSWDYRKDIVVNAIKAQAPDILGLQECLKMQSDYLADALPEYERFGVGREADGSGERMEVFYRSSRLAPLEAGNFWLSETPEVPGSRSWKSANVRMATWLRFHDFQSGRTFVYLNTHLDHRSEDARREAARLLFRWAGDLQKDIPVAISGDFNATAEQSVPWETLTKGFSDAWVVAAKRVGPPVTWSAFAAPSDEIRRIDWILVREGISVSQCETVTYNEDSRYPSDHFPVVATLEFLR